MDYVHFIGIDVSKEWFDVACHGEVRAARFANDRTGVAAFLRGWKGPLTEAFVVLEATGGYEKLLLQKLLSAGVTVHRADPRASSFFIRSLPGRAKTDARDAVALARYGAERHATLRPARLQEKEQERLEMLRRRRADLVAMRVAEQNRAAHPTYAGAKDSFTRTLTMLNREIARLDHAMQELIARTAPLAEKARIMTSMTGVGPHTATTLLACLPELGTLNRKQIASLAGCAPHPKDSGKTSAYRKTTGGKADVKRALFVAAMSARNHHPDLKNFYGNLIQNGKKPMVAMVAVMRKIITILNAKIRDEIYQKTSW